MTQHVELSGTQRLTYTQGWDAENRLIAVTNSATTPNQQTGDMQLGQGPPRLAPARI